MFCFSHWPNCDFGKRFPEVFTAPVSISSFCSSLKLSLTVFREVFAEEEETSATGVATSPVSSSLRLLTAATRGRDAVTGAGALFGTTEETEETEEEEEEEDDEEENDDETEDAETDSFARIWSSNSCVGRASDCTLAICSAEEAKGRSNGKENINSRPFS